jgi:predicted nucleic acid-binding protein
MTKSEAVSLGDFMSENWEKFAAFETAAEEGLTEISRRLPPDLHSIIRGKVLELLIGCVPLDADCNASTLKVRLVVDANIIVQDSFRVAKGVPSSTLRVLSSPYLELLAPEIMEEEVERIVREKLPRGASLKKALAHSRQLLSRISMLPKATSASIETACSLIAQHSPEDVPFLAIAIDSEADAIVSRDQRAFDQQEEIIRWEMGETVVACVTCESGSLSLVVLGATAEAAGEVFETMLIEFSHALEIALELLVCLVVGITEKSVEMLSCIPGWAWAVLIGVGLGALLASILHEGFRDWLGGAASKTMDILASFGKALVQVGTTLWGAFKAILIWLWNLLLPVGVATLLIVGVLCRRIWRLLVQEMSRSS